MTYEEALRRVHASLRFGMKPGLERIRALMARLGDPQNRLHTVHVAGTNGKGTTCTLIAAALRAAGYRTGLYTSPYVTDFRERFQIDGEMIPEEEFVDCASRVFPAADAVAPEYGDVTEFELITAIAFDWFARRGCGCVVLEVGLGGRLDATNVIPVPDAAVITSISLDHTAVLGGTLEEIAAEKAGILKPGGHAVLYPEQAPEVFETIRRIAAERGVECAAAPLAGIRETGATLEGSTLAVDGKELFLPFTGAHQEKNAATALAALELLRRRGYRIPWEAVKTGFANARIPARMEILGRRPLALLDGGHNPGCAQALAAVLRRFLPGKKLVAVMGMLADKDSRASLAAVAPLFSTVLTLRPENPRALSAQALRDEAAAFCPDARAMEDPEEALRLAAALAGPDGAVILCGSFYLAGELRPLALRLFGE